MIKKYFVLLSFLSVLSFLSTLFPVLAAVTCTTQYGGGQTCTTTGQLLLNKKVYDPNSKQMVDNLTINDYKFTAGEEVTFSIDVKNVGDSTINNLTFTDTLPAFLTWTSGDLTSTIDSLTPGQTRTFTVKAKVNESGAGCAVNTALATAEGISDQDTAQVCLKGTVPAEIPQAGPEMGVLTLLPALAGIGWYLKKNSHDSTD